MVGSKEDKNGERC